MIDEGYAHERAQAFLNALSDLWTATDYQEWTDLKLYTDQDLKAILGQWGHIRKACDALYAKIRAARPDLPGWDPIRGDQPLA